MTPCASASHPGYPRPIAPRFKHAVAQRVVRWVVRRGSLDGDDGGAMLEWQRAIFDCVGEPVKPPPITLSPRASILGRYVCSKRRYARTRSTRTRVRVRPGRQLVDNLSVFLPL
jgi:hypothetical protein